jgi:hypothetical protein
MNNEKREFLNLKNIPARLEMQEAGWYLGFAPHAIPILISAGLLKPLGHPPANAVKYFATATLTELRDDAQWLARATDALTRYWQHKNARASTSNGGPASRTVSQRVVQRGQPRQDPVTESGAPANV